MAKLDEEVQTFISAKVKKLMEEGKDRAEAVAAAFTAARSKFGKEKVPEAN